MKSMLMAVLAVLGMSGAHAAPVTLFEAPPNVLAPAGEGADSGTGPLSVSYSAGPGTVLNELTWWGYHTPDSTGVDDFVVTLNGLALTGTVSAQATGTVWPVAQTNDQVALIRYAFNLGGAVAQAGGNEFTIINDEAGDDGAVWFWQGSGTASFSPAWGLTGERLSQDLPEPGSLALAGLALVGMMGARRRLR